MPGTDLTYLREAARMFESTGKFEFAASCYRDSGEFERAGKMYFDVCEKIDEAAECFTLAGCYSEAAEDAKGSQFSNCLLVCKKGKLFYKGLEYIKYWKEHVHVISNEMESIEQEFLESGALHFHEHNDRITMMTFVRCFCSMESKRVFLRSSGCHDDLLLLEEEFGHFFEAAELARSCGDVLKEANLLEKAGHLKDTMDLLLWYVSFTSLWGNGNKGWPLKQFPQKEDLCSKVKLLAIKESDILYDFASSELKVLSDQSSFLPDLKKDLYDSLKNKSKMGEILSIRKILDAHFLISFSEYEWEDELPYDINKHCEIKITKNKVSVRTLVHYWNLWKENVASIFQGVVIFENEEPSNDADDHVDFIFNYFGVRKKCVSGNMVYLLVDKDADWIRNVGQEGLHNDGKLLTIDMKQLVFAIRSYWQSELLYVGMTVLETLEGAQNSKSKCSAFQQSTFLLHIFEVSKFLLDCKYLNLTDIYKDMLQNFLGISLTYFDIVFPLDWRETVSEDLVSLKETDLSLSLLDEIILRTVNVEGDFTFRTLGRVMMICFSSRKPSAHYVMLFKGLLFSAEWNSFFEIFFDDGFKDTYAIIFQNAFKDAHICDSSVSPHSFLYLLESLLSMAYSSSGTIFTTKSSFVGCLTHIRSTASPILSAPKHIYSEDLVSSVVEIIQEVLYNKEDTIAWIKKSKIDHSYYHPLLASKLVTVLSLICPEISDFSQVLVDLMSDRNTIAYLLPENFVFNLLRGRNGRYLNLNPELVSEAFLSVDDPLLIVSSENESPAVHAPSAIFVDLTKSKAEIMSVLFPKKDTDSGQNSSNNVGVGNELPYKVPNLNPVELRMHLKALEELSEAINKKKEEALNSLSAADTIKVTFRHAERIG